jgi:hypothetical protein
LNSFACLGRWKIKLFRIVLGESLLQAGVRHHGHEQPRQHRRRERQ